MGLNGDEEDLIEKDRVELEDLDSHIESQRKLLFTETRMKANNEIIIEDVT